ncbi:MAG: YeeE/YedE family protein [Cyclobacteriaceae bacterium]|nr:YeeE/YedE family protein [Cyclobacteriaceae bacterium]
MSMLDLIRQPWPWYVSGALIGLTVPLLLLLGNKHFGISSSLRHICAACIPGKVPFFQYNWKREAWNLFFVGGIVVGAALASQFLNDPEPVQVAEKTAQALADLGVAVDGKLMPASIFSFDNLFTLKGLVFFVIGGFLVGFGTRYAGGCTSGHSILGLSTLQWPSLVATCCFMAGGFIMVQLIYPWLLKVV